MNSLYAVRESNNQPLWVGAALLESDVKGLPGIPEAVTNPTLLPPGRRPPIRDGHVVCRAGMHPFLRTVI